MRGVKMKIDLTKAVKITNKAYESGYSMKQIAEAIEVRYPYMLERIKKKKRC